MKYFGKYLDMFVSNRTKKTKKLKTKKKKTKRRRRREISNDDWSGIV